MNFIALAREKAGLSQAELAEKLDVSTGTVAAWELLPDRDAGHNFKLSRLTKVAKALKVSRRDLLNWWMEMSS